ncbi:uncharacterized protein PolG2 isoform X2 [Lepeophtheirus salmonis]|uniref:uncharacterized protein PolG2 isoform X2 n=1 Tax=Lepeophtheirus salmonis TaxID=72036 RepID=UPI003AF336E9
MIKTLSKHLSPFTNRHFSSIHKDPIDGKDNGDKRIKSSLRRDKNVQKPEEELGCLKTTSGFRKYVGDALAKRLDDLIDEVSCSLPSKDTYSEDKDSGGVQLFSSTEVITQYKEEEERPSVKREKPDLLAHRRLKKKKKKKTIDKSDSSSEDDEHFKDVAVTPDWVIGQKGVFKHPPKEADEVISNVKSKKKDPKLKCLND